LEAFNAVGFTIFDIPGYFFFTVIGLVTSISAFIALIADKKYSLQKNLLMLFIVAICVIAFARIFGCISGIYRDVGMSKEITFDGIKQTGIVYYGGLIGLLVSYSIMSKKAQDVYIMDVLAVCIPLFHSVARVGCFFGGCCFGKESHSIIAINYTTKVFDEVTTAYRIPTQLIEAAFNFCLFLYLLHLVRSEDWKNKHILRRYLFLYSIGRFVIEFFRGDLVRGVIFGVSFSQVISILIWVHLLVTLHSRCNKNEVKEELTV
jgi:phosphatidylglycerol:prolipoprotein diacylglycerol transferase